MCKDLRQDWRRRPGVFNVFRPGATFTFSYGLVGRKATIEDNLVKHLGNISGMLLN
jgi:hypothetical protein